VVTAKGAGTFDDFLGAMNRMTADPAFSPDFDVIADFREMRYTPSIKEIQRFASVFEKVQKSFPKRVGIVVADKVQLRLGRFASLIAKVLHFDISVFEEPSAAFAWLDQRKVLNMTEIKTKILEILEKPQLTALATVTAEGKPWVRYVMTKASPDLTIRFATFRESRKTNQISANPEVHLITGATSLETAERWVQIEGKAEVSVDENERRQFWNSGLKAYFDGPDDPDYVVVIVRPYRIEYMEMASSKPEIWRA
jgi:general stress protein 26